MPNCSVFWCKKRSETSSFVKDKTTFHLFPKDAGIRNIWVKACGNHVTWVAKRTSTVCSQHFETSCFIIQSKNKRKLKPGAVPTLKLSKVGSCEECQCEPDTSEPKRRKGVETIEDQDTQLKQLQTQACETSNVHHHPLEFICTSTNATYNLKLVDTPRNDPCEEYHCEPDTSEPKRRKGVEAFEDQDTQSKQLQTQECETSNVHHHPFEFICTSTKATYNPQSEDTPRNNKIKKCLQMKNKKIKRLQMQKRNLKKKVAGLKEMLNTRTEKH